VVIVQVLFVYCLRGG